LNFVCFANLLDPLQSSGSFPALKLADFFSLAFQFFWSKQSLLPNAPNAKDGAEWLQVLRSKPSTHFSTHLLTVVVGENATP